MTNDKEKLKKYFEFKQAQLTEAYEVLSHTWKRQQYDLLGKVC